MSGDGGESHHRFAVPLPLTGEAKTGASRERRAEQSPAPTVLYECGGGDVRSDGSSRPTGPTLARK